MNFTGLMTMNAPKALAAAMVLLAANTAGAGTLNGGVFNVSFDNPDNLLEGLTLGPGAVSSYYVANFFDKSLADSDALNETGELIAVSSYTYPAPATLSFQLNPASLAGTGIPYGSGGRNNQITTLAWAADQDALVDASSFSATGQVGLNGVVMTRGSFGGTLISGDYKFSYIAGRNDGVNSGWALTNYISFASTSYDTRNISVTTDGDSLIFSGELWWSPSSSAFLFGGDGSSSAGRAGTFSLVSPAPVPLPAGIWLFVSGLLGVLASKRRHALAVSA